LVVQDGIKIPDRSIGIEGRAIMVLHALAEFNNPSPTISFIHPPGSGEARHQPGRRIRL
jgi:hypothetical protein